MPPMWGGGDAARSLLASSEERGPNTRPGCFRRLGLERGGAGLIIPFYRRSLPGVGPSPGWDPGAVDARKEVRMFLATGPGTFLAVSPVPHSGRLDRSIPRCGCWCWRG